MQRYTANVDPTAKLFYNEYSIHNLTPKFDYVLMMLRDLVAAKVPVHGIGIQMHVDNTSPAKVWNATAFRIVLDKFAALGLEIHITELNVPYDDPMYHGLTPAGKLAAQARLYSDILSLCLATPTCKSFETWG
jgi:endo-1,4-beta-xylanase